MESVSFGSRGFIRRSSPSPRINRSSRLGSGCVQTDTRSCPRNGHHSRGNGTAGNRGQLLSAVLGGRREGADALGGGRAEGNQRLGEHRVVGISDCWLLRSPTARDSRSFNPVTSPEIADGASLAKPSCEPYKSVPSQGCGSAVVAVRLGWNTDKHT